MRRFCAGIAAAPLEPRDVFVAGDEGIFAVDALAGPVCDPVGRIARNCVVPKVSGSRISSSPW